MYQDPKPKPGFLAQKQAQLPIGPPIALSSPFFPPQFQTYFNNFMKSFHSPFIYKDYNIHIGGPNADHFHASMIYEDALPSEKIFTSYKTLKERNSLLDYVRSTFIQVQEGEFVNWDGDCNSLNARLKLIELGPFSTTKYAKNNPYAGLGKGMLLYSSCYPITIDNNGFSKCQKNSVGMNVRCYLIEIEALKAWNPNMVKSIMEKTPEGKLITQVQINPGNEKFKYNVWRDLLYYEFIREHINKKIICPNFIQSYCYFIDKKSKVSFNKNGVYGSKILSIKLDNPDNSGVSAILLTESPNQSLYGWASNSYVSDKNIQSQVYVGYKPVDNWKVIIFQMIVVFYIMKKHQFTYYDMKITNNFFIKNINTFGETFSQYWLYNINGMSYYVPCKGDLLLVDNDYHDFTTTDGQIYFKIISKIFNDSETLINERIMENAKLSLDSNNFGKNFTESGGVRPSDEIIELLTNINSDLKRGYVFDTNPSENIFEDLIKKYFVEYVHNRVGTLVRDTEKPFIKKQDVRPFTKGELVVYESKFDTYEILIYIKSIDDYTCECATKVGPETNKDVVIGNFKKDMLYHFAQDYIVLQDITMGQPSGSLDYLIENYIM